MRVVDSSAWIEWIAGSDLGRRLQAEFPSPSNWAVPTMVQLEVFKWTARNAGEAKAAEVLALTQTLLVFPLTTPIAVRAANLSLEGRLPTADAVIYATALELRADLLTCDAHFEGLPGAIYVAKG